MGRAQALLFVLRLRREVARACCAQAVANHRRVRRHRTFTNNPEFPIHPSGIELPCHYWPNPSGDRFGRLSSLRDGASMYFASHNTSYANQRSMRTVQLTSSPESNQNPRCLQHGPPKPNPLPVSLHPWPLLGSARSLLPLDLYAPLHNIIPLAVCPPTSHPTRL
jgi:hypothetical protein